MSLSFGSTSLTVRAGPISYVSSSGPNHGRQARWHPFHTLTVDLTEDLEAIFARFKKDTRNEIRRAQEKDRVQCRCWSQPSPEVLEQFLDFYAKFAADNGLSVVNSRISTAARTGCLHLSAAEADSGEPLVWHAYLHIANRVRLLHSASLFRKAKTVAERNMIGRANRLQHWLDMVQFKKAGVLTYDFGGWYDGNLDQKKLRINQFKEEFGGRVVCEFNSEAGVSAIGRSVLLLLPVLRVCQLPVERMRTTFLRSRTSRA